MQADRPGSVVARVLSRKTIRSGFVWGLAFGVTAVSSIVQFTTAYATAESRSDIARSIGGNGAMQALFGSGRSLETIPGWVAWRSLGIVIILGSVWGLLAGTRWLRGEEESGRWDVLVTGPTTRRRATAAAVVAMAAGLVTLWATTAAVIAAADWRSEADFGFRATLFLAMALVAPAAVALAVGAFVSQLVATRRQASALGAIVLAAAYLVRMAGNGPPGLRWLQWATPFGWVRHLRPLTGSSPWPLLPLAALVIGLAVAAVLLAGGRDVGAGVRSSGQSAPARCAFLNSPLGLAVRLERPVLLAWAAGVAVLSFFFGLIAGALADTSSAGLSTALARLGAQQSGLTAYLGTFYLIVGAVLAFVGAGQIAAARQEETEGRLDTLLTQPISRLTWLATRLAVAGGGLVALAVVAGAAGWAGAASQHAEIGFGRVVAAALNAALPSLVVVGLGVLALGLAPRFAVPVVFASVAWSFAVKFLLLAGPGSRVLLDLSLFHHVALMPAAPFRVGAASALVGSAVGGAAAGMVALRRRDLAGA